MTKVSKKAATKTAAPVAKKTAKVAKVEKKAAAPVTKSQQLMIADGLPVVAIKEAKAVEAKAETAPAIESKPDAAAKKQGMGEGQKAVTQAYKDNWNDIFGKKKKR